MNKVVRRDEIYHYGVKGMKWKESKKNLPVDPNTSSKKTSIPDAIKAILDKFKSSKTVDIPYSEESYKKAELVVFKKSSLTLKDMITGTGTSTKVELKGYTKVQPNSSNTQSNSSNTGKTVSATGHPLKSNGKVKLIGFTKK